MKCDETKPSCDRCRSTGRSCDGYAPPSFSRRDLLAASHRSASGPIIRTLCTDPAFSTDAERRQFDFFRSCTVPATNSLFGSVFWNRIVLQLAHREPAIKYAVSALSAVHQLATLQERDSTCHHLQQNHAHSSYTRAVSQAQKLLSATSKEDLRTVLVLCVLFTCYENVRNEWRWAQTHLKSGLAILSYHWGKDSRGTEIAPIADVLRRQHLAALILSDTRMPYEHEKVDFPQATNLHPSHDLDMFRDSLMNMLSYLLHINGQYFRDFWTGSSPIMPNLEKHLRRAKLELRAWRIAFEQAIASRTLPRDQHAIAFIWLYYHVTNILVEAGSNNDEMRWDAFEHEFAMMIEHATRFVEYESKDTGLSGQKTLSFEMGLIMPLSLLGSRCRSPSLRTKSLKILGSKERREGFWSSTGAMEVQKALMNIEEDGLGEIHSAAEIPGEKRVHNIELMFHRQERQLSVHMMTLPYGLKGDWLIKTVRVPFAAADDMPHNSAQCRQGDIATGDHKSGPSVTALNLSLGQGSLASLACLDHMSKVTSIIQKHDDA